MQYYLTNPYLRRVLVVVGLDLASFVLAFGLAIALLKDAPWGSSAMLPIALGGLGAFIALFYCRCYTPEALASDRTPLRVIWPAMALIFGAALALCLLPNLAPEYNVLIPVTLAAYLPLLYLARAAFRKVSALPRFNQRVVILGASDLGLEIAEALHARPNLGIHLVGFLSDTIAMPDQPGTRFAGYPVLGRAHDLEKVLDEHRIGRIVVASKDRGEHFPADTLLRAKLEYRQVEAGIAFFERVTGQIYLRELRASYLIFSPGFRPSRTSIFMKRVIDLVASGIGLALALPVLGLTAIAIKLDSAGPVLYRQERLGEGGKIFDVLKLRSMVRQAETGKAQFTSKGDVRVTRVGRFIRRTRIDELPQLINVFRGEMSLVGPRPERPEVAQALIDRFPYFRLRCHVKPGCTGWAQIRHGYVNEIEGFEEKMALDLYYMKYRSVTMDLLILWKTARTLFLLEGI